MLTHPMAFWLVLPAWAALILLRLYRARRREILAGSLLLWRRLAAQQPKARPKRLVVDGQLILQALALLAIIAALSGPAWVSGQEQGRGLVLAVDNNSLSRARLPDGTQLWKFMLNKAEKIVRGLRPQDKVFLIRAAPRLEVMASEGFSPSAALLALAEVQPAVSGPDAASVFSFAVDAARSLGKDKPLPLAVISLRDGPAGINPSQWLCVAPENTMLRNTGIVAFGALPVGGAQIQALVRLKNFSTQPAQGKVSLEAFGAAWQPRETKELSLNAQGEKAVVFTVPREDARPIRIHWKDSAGPDAFPEDDTIVAVPQKIAPPRVRFHGSAPAVEKLYKQALDAKISAAGTFEPVDLEIYVRSVPEEVPEGTRAVMLLAPESGYQVFDVDASVLARPLAQRDEDDELIKGVDDKPEGVFPVNSARQIRHTGDFKSLLKDRASGRTLVARFLDDKGRLGFLLAFMPGQDTGGDVLWDASLAAILVRMAEKAAGAGEPFTVTPAAELERRAPLPLDWPLAMKDNGANGGVLDENTSALPLGRGRAGEAEPVNAVSLSKEESAGLAPWLVVLALSLMGVESLLARRKSKRLKAKSQKLMETF